MPRYKLREHAVGEVFYWDEGDVSVNVDSPREAQRILYDETGELHAYLSTRIVRAELVYQRMIDAEEFLPDGVDAGDTMFWLDRDDGHELNANEARVWTPGWPGIVDWRMASRRPRVWADQLPVGAQVRHRRLGDGRTATVARRRGGQWFIRVDFESGVTRECTAVRLSLNPYLGNWRPPVLYDLSIDGRVIATGSRGSMQALLDARRSRLRAEWEAENFLDPTWLEADDGAALAIAGDAR